MTSGAFFSFFNFHLQPIRALNPKNNPKQTLAPQTYPAFSDEKTPQKAKQTLKNSSYLYFITKTVQTPKCARSILPESFTSSSKTS